MDNRSNIFSTEKGAVVIKSEVKNKIISLLMEGEKTSREIREELGKAKSTISVHLSDLKELDIIREKVHPEDERKKIFYINSKLLGMSEPPFDEHYKHMLDNLKDASGDSYEFLKSLFHLIRYGLTSFGLDIHPALKEIGRDAGREIADKFDSNDIEGLLVELKRFWSENQLGEIKVVDENSILVKDCFDCCDMPDLGTTFCSLDEGMIEGIIEAKLDIDVEVKETECFGTGDNHCRFNIQER